MGGGIYYYIVCYYGDALEINREQRETLSSEVNLAAQPQTGTLITRLNFNPHPFLLPQSVHSHQTEMSQKQSRPQNHSSV